MPLTDNTRGIPERFVVPRQTAEGGRLINAGRGGLQIEADIIAALDPATISRPCWMSFQPSRCRRTIRCGPIRRSRLRRTTPLTGSMTGAREVAANLKRVLAGAQPHNIVNPNAGYQ